ncbi:OmpH family outer membrane protein [Flavobacterium soyangense]|nr:OmpH family outer membrane protein [Flavobacterium soyangense]
MKSKIHEYPKTNMKMMSKKIVVIIAIAISIVSCNKPAAEVKEVKTAYVDTSVLMKEYTATKDLDAKYKAKGEEKGRQLQAEIEKFKLEASNFQAQAQANGQAWAQQKGAELQRREQQLGQAQQALAQQLQQEGGVEMDSLVADVKKIIKAYGKEKGFAYIYGTGDSNASILYAEDKYDITKEIIKLLNDKYKTPAAKEEVKK